MELWSELINAGLTIRRPKTASTGAGFEGEPGPCGGVTTSEAAVCTLGDNWPGPRAPLGVTGDIRELEMMDSIPLGRIKWLAWWSVPMDADSGYGA